MTTPTPNNKNRTSYRYHIDFSARLIVDKLEHVADDIDEPQLGQILDALELAKMLRELTGGGSISDT